MAWKQNQKRLFELSRGCEGCGKTLLGRAKRDIERKRFCSYACAGKAAILLHDRTVIPLRDLACAECGQAFKSNASKAKYCSLRCSQRTIQRNYAARRATLSGHLVKLRARPGRTALSQAYLLGLYNRQDGRCALSGVTLTWITGRGHTLTNISIDRIDPKGEYVPGNVQLVCWVINVMRRDLDPDEFVDWCTKVVEANTPVVAKVA